MKGLLIKDLCVITKQLKIFLVAIVVLSLLGGSSNSLLAMYFGAILPLTSFSYDEKAKWNEFAVMMPFSKSELVLSKFLLGYLCIAGAALLVFTSSLISSAFILQGTSINISAILLSVVAALIAMPINNMFFFIFGSEKGRLFFVVCMVAVSALSAFFNSVSAQVLGAMQNLSVAMAVLVAVAINFACVKISQKRNIL